MTKSYPFSKQNKKLAEFHEHYEYYLSCWNLCTAHIVDLSNRKIPSEYYEIARYRSKLISSSNPAKEALAMMVRKYGDKLLEVPGFFKNKKTGHTDHLCTYGMLIPARCLAGEVKYLIIKNDKPNKNKNNKYVFFSSGGNDGPKVEPSIHCPNIKGNALKVCGAELRVTEGVLKSDAATILGDYYCVGTPGLQITDDLEKIIEETEVEGIRICLDAGEDENDDMIEAKANLILLAKKIGVEFVVELWDPKYGKGIDDVLAAGNSDKIRFATQKEIDSILNRSRAVKPTINVVGGGLSSQATQGEKALINAEFPIYQRGQKLVRPVKQIVEAAKGKRTEIAVLSEITPTKMIDYLCQVANWQIPKPEGRATVINPPPNVASTLVNRFGDWDFPSLAGVITTPTIRPDGSILQTPGYDEKTRLYLFSPPPMPEISIKPTKDQAANALKLLKGLLGEFPFEDEASISVALSMIITPIVRGACSVVPLHAATAPTPGTGKSYLLDIAAGISIGQRCPIIAAGRNEEETEKRLGAALIQGQSILSIDNLNGDLSGDALCQMIERPQINVRPLGESRLITIESRTTLFANGNNLRLTGDITRRAIQCRLDAKCERPDMRDFSGNPFETVTQDRGEYVAAALTIVRAYIEAGQPDIIKPRLASFEDWSDLVRSALAWLDCEDPVASMNTARSEDPTLRNMAEVYSAIWDKMEGQAFTAREIIKIATEKDDAFEDRQFINPGLREALLNVAADRGGYMINAQRLGHWLSRHKGRVCDSLYLQNKTDNHKHAAVWWLTKND